MSAGQSELSSDVNESVDGVVWWSLPFALWQLETGTTLWYQWIWGRSEDEWVITFCFNFRFPSIDIPRLVSVRSSAAKSSKVCFPPQKLHINADNKSWGNLLRFYHLHSHGSKRFLSPCSITQCERKRKVQPTDPCPSSTQIQKMEVEFYQFISLPFIHAWFISSALHLLKEDRLSDYVLRDFVMHGPQGEVNLISSECGFVNLSISHRLKWYVFPNLFHNLTFLFTLEEEASGNNVHGLFR